MNKHHKLLPRVLISLLGLALILMGLSEVMLGFVGASAPATITNIRREGGERSDGKPGRYTYNISYSFTLPDGRKMDGFTKKIGNSVFIKASGATATEVVKYFPQFPYLNALAQNTGLGAGQVVLMLAGTALIYLMNQKNKREE